MNHVIDQARRLWGYDDVACTLVAARENAVYRVTTATQTVALRLHRQGYRTNAALRSELAWMAALAKGGLSVPAPIPCLAGQFLQVIDGFQVDVLTWLPGATMETALTHSDRPTLFRNLGRAMAQLHALSDAWSPPPQFDRCRWDRAGLLGDTPLWDRFWENPALNDDDRTLFEAFRTAANAQLSAIDDKLDKGLIHADLVAANVIIDGATLCLIDFDDGGFGYRIFDVATALLKHREASDFAALQTALLQGYRQIRPLDTSHLALFMAIRAATYVGWNITRMAEDKTATRNTRFINTARDTIQTYLQTL